PEEVGGASQLWDVGPVLDQDAAHRPVARQWLHTDASGDRAPTGPGRRMGSVPADIGRKPGAVVRHPPGRHAAPLHHLIIKPAVHLGAPAAESDCRSSPAKSTSPGRPMPAPAK